MFGQEFFVKYIFLFQTTIAIYNDDNKVRIIVKP